ncbi:hypothetical protein AAC387_Pa01g0066 [Persea americana]
MDCCVFVGREWRRKLSMSKQLRYHPLSDDEDDDRNNSQNWVTVVVGKEKRVFVVDPFVLEKDPFRVLLETMREKRSKGELDENKEEGVIFVSVDAILFEHMLWLMHNDCSSFFQLNLMEIIEFYAQDC